MLVPEYLFKRLIFKLCPYPKYSALLCPFILLPGTHLFQLFYVFCWRPVFRRGPLLKHLKTDGLRVPLWI